MASCSALSYQIPQSSLQPSRTRCASSPGCSYPVLADHRLRQEWPAPTSRLSSSVVNRASNVSLIARSSSSSNGAGSAVANVTSSSASSSRRVPSSSSTPSSTTSSPVAGSGLGGDDFFRPGSEGEARQRLFDTIAPVYDQLNDSLSLGLHRIWKRMTVQWSGAARGNAALDVCCGSGDLALLLAEAVGPTGSVTGLDFSGAMLDDARRREAAAAAAAGGRGMAPMRWVQGDALDLPFEAGSFDAITMGYGLRNVADIPRALRELHRVLKPGGTVAILDFNNAGDNFLADRLQAIYLERIVVPAATAQGLAEEYRYLRPSIQRFPAGRQQEQLARDAGFSKAAHYAITFGQMGVLVATK